jgi:hypothetical protein
MNTLPKASEDRLKSFITNGIQLSEPPSSLFSPFLHPRLKPQVAAHPIWVTRWGVTVAITEVESC